MIINSANIKALSLLGQKGSVFNYGLLEAAAEHDNLRLLTADLALLTGLDRFRRKYPERFLHCRAEYDRHRCGACHGGRDANRHHLLLVSCRKRS